MERVLQVVPSMISGGTESFIMNLYRNIDRNKIQFDFLVHTKKKGYYDEEIKKLGGRIYYLTLKDDLNIFKYIKELKVFLKKHNEYKTLHVNMPSTGFIPLKIAKRIGVKTRIAHSHQTSFNSGIKGLIFNFTSKLMYKYSTINIACSKKAGNFMFKNDKFVVIPNSIDTTKFVYNLDYRNEIRNRLGINNKIVIGHVGRFAREKNQLFLLKLMKKVDDKRFHLILIGNGPLKKYIRSEKSNDKEYPAVWVGVGRAGWLFVGERCA